jgi:hypothetical protein
MVLEQELAELLQVKGYFETKQPLQDLTMRFISALFFW